MQGVIIYTDKEDKEQSYYFSGMRYDQTPADLLKERGVEYKEIKECWDEA